MNAVRGALRRKATGAFQEELLTFATAEFTNRATITCHECSSSSAFAELSTKLQNCGDTPGRVRARPNCLDAALLGRPAAVWRHRGDVGNRAHLQAAGLNGADRGFTARPGLSRSRPPLAPMFLGDFRGALGCQPRRVGRALAGALKPEVPALAHEITLPCWSLRLTMVLLKVAWTCACPYGIFFLTLRCAAPRRPPGSAFWYVPCLIHPKGNELQVGGTTNHP
jgi:hypothetical protein